jgi:DNA-directed RNA polymerase beta' subunit
MFDGDEMNIHIAQSVQARNELKRIANVKYQIIGAKDSNPIIGCVQDALSGCYLLTKLNNKISGADVSNFLCTTSSDTKFEIDKHKTYTGHEIFSHIIPKGINNTVYKNDKKVIEIIDGELKLGTLDKNTLSTVKNSIIHFIWDKYGPDKTRRFIDDAQRLALAYLNYRGFTFGIKDCISSDIINQQVKDLIRNKILEYKISLTQYENDIDQLNHQIIEANLSGELNAFSSDIGNELLKSLNPENNLFVCIDSKSKGNSMNLQHIMACVGQKSVEGTRIKKKIENRTISIFHKDDDTPEARGFIKNSYLDGLNSYEFFYDAMAGREGLIDTAIKTAKTGYIQRQLIKGLEDLVIKYDNTNRNSRNIIIQYIYGENGIEQSSQTELQIKLIALDNKEIEAAYGFTSDEIKKLEKEHKIKTLDAFNKKYVKKIKDFRDKLRVIQATTNNNYKTLEEKYNLPVNLFRLTQDYSKNKVNLELNPEDIVNDIDELLNSPDTRLLPGLKASDKYLLQDDRSMKYLFEIALNDYLCPKKCIFEYGLSKKDFKALLADIKFNFIKALIQPGEMVGIIAAQSIGEPTSQMSLMGNHRNKIIIKNKVTNMISMISTEIGPFCDDIIKNNPELTYGTGHVNSVETGLSTLENEYYIIGVDKKEKTHWNKISHVSRHPVNGQVMKVTTKSGRIVHTTTSHSHLIRANQTVEPIVGANMTVGMRIPVARHINNTFIKQTINIDSQVFNLDYLFGWFIGAYLAEGSLNGNIISISNISDHFINNTTKFAKLFNKEANVRKYQGEYGPSTSTSFNYKPLASLILDTCGNGSFLKKVPDFAFIAPNEFKAGLLQAYFDGAGTFVPDETRYQIRVCSRSEQLIKDMALLLSYFDMFGSIKANMTKGSMMYNLAMSAKYSVQYKEHVGSLVHTDKLDQIVTYATRADAHDLSDEIDKINGLGEVIAKCGKELNLPGQSRRKKKESIGRRTLEKYIEIFESHEENHKIREELSILKQASESGVIWDEVKEIKIYDIDPSDYVYDFTVPGNQTFMTDTGIIVHNTLNTKHSAGVASKSTTNMGVSRIEELLHYSKDIKTPQMTVYFDDKISADRSEVNKIASYLTHLKIKELITSAEIIYDIGSNDEISKSLIEDKVSSPFFVNNQKAELSTMPFVFRIKLNMETMHDKETTLLDIKTKFISYWTKNFTNFKNMKKLEKDIFSKISRCAILSNTAVNNQIIHIRFNMSSFNYNLLTDFLNIVLNQITLKGIDNITSSDMINERKLRFNKETGSTDVSKEYIVYTAGINLEKIKYIKGVNHSLSTCNDIATIYRLYGIESARQMLINEFNQTFNAGGSKSINHNHMSVLIDMMTHTGGITSIDRHGLGKVDYEPIAKASFEKTMDHFLNAAIFNEKDHIESVSSRIMMGRVIPGGTGCFELLLDTNKLENSEYTKNEKGGRVTFIGLEEESLFKDIIKFGFSKNDFFLPV